MSRAPEWQAQAECRGADPGLFFSSDESPGFSYAAGRAYCARCPVQRECLDYAVANEEEWGLWGGLTPKERGIRNKKGRNVFYSRPCVTCGRDFQPRMPSHLSCSKSCAVVRENQMSNERKQRPVPVDTDTPLFVRDSARA